MIEYSADGDTAFYCGYKFRKDPNTGYFLCTRKTDAGIRERLHVFVYRHEHGDIPKGMHIHHADENKNNNEPDNLVMLTESEHEKYHANHWSDERKQVATRIVTECAIPKAIEWHKSEVGRKWHSEHAKLQAESLTEKEYTCRNCGKRFYKKPLWNIGFCSNNCKSAFRRKNGIDNVKRICPVCGNEYEANKYSTKKYCSKKCRDEFHRNICD